MKSVPDDLPKHTWQFSHFALGIAFTSILPWFGSALIAVLQLHQSSDEIIHQISINATLFLSCYVVQSIGMFNPQKSHIIWRFFAVIFVIAIILIAANLYLYLDGALIWQISSRQESRLQFTRDYATRDCALFWSWNMVRNPQNRQKEPTIPSCLPRLKSQKSAKYRPHSSKRITLCSSRVCTKAILQHRFLNTWHVAKSL